MEGILFCTDSIYVTETLMSILFIFILSMLYAITFMVCYKEIRKAIQKNHVILTWWAISGGLFCTLLLLFIFLKLIVKV
jgi:hypothetical protein